MSRTSRRLPGQGECCLENYLGKTVQLQGECCPEKVGYLGKTVQGERCLEGYTDQMVQGACCVEHYPGVTARSGGLSCQAAQGLSVTYSPLCGSLAKMWVALAGLQNCSVLPCCYLTPAMFPVYLLFLSG